MLKSFRQFAEEAVKEVTLTFGRFNPPTKGHLKLIEKVKNVSSSGTYRIFVSQTVDKEKNPLSYETKVKYMRDMFSQHSRAIIQDTSIHTIIDALKQLSAQGFTKANIVVGADRLRDFEFLQKYNSEEGGEYYFPDGIHFVSAGDRDPESEGTKGISASKMRYFALEGMFSEFRQGLPQGYRKAQQLFNDVRKGMGLKPVTNFREHVELPSHSTKRELYVAGEIFQPGSIVRESISQRVIEIAECKSNFVIDTKGRKHFIESLELDEEEKTYKPPAGAKAAAKKALKWKEQHGDEVKAMTQTGWTRANQLASGESLSYDTVKRMHSFFSRHSGNEKISAENKDTPWKDNGYVSFLGWGGSEGKSWAEKIINKKDD
jgi:phosphopantetheine adenylyltransferase